MPEHRVKVKLLGEAGRLFVREMQLIANSPAEIIRGINANFPSFRAYLLKNSFHLLRAKPGTYRDYGEGELLDPVGDYDFVLVPATDASGGLLRIVAGAAIAGVSAIVGFTPGIYLGASIALGGLHQLLTPTPSTPDGANEREDSFLSTGATGTSRYGDPIAPQFGLVRIKDPIAMSSGIFTEQLA